jgi:hypothetical protein
LQAWVAAHVPVAEAPAVQAALAALRQVPRAGSRPDPTTGQSRIRRGVAVDRQPSIGDPAMRHGRKTKTRPFTGFKRHIITLVDADAVVRPANEPEHATLARLSPPSPRCDDRDIYFHRRQSHTRRKARSLWAIAITIGAAGGHTAESRPAPS